MDGWINLPIQIALASAQPRLAVLGAVGFGHRCGHNICVYIIYLMLFYITLYHTILYCYSILHNIYYIY
jgi:hypothetical protein